VSLLLLCCCPQLLQDFECFINSKSPKDKAADLVLLEADLQEQHHTLPGLVSPAYCGLLLGGGGWV